MFSKSLIAASSKPLILGVLTMGRSYGYEIIQKVKKLSGGKIEWADGMLYPVLHRLEKEGLIRSEWIIKEGERPRKYYSITKEGLQSIEDEKQHWMSLHEVLLKIWNLTPPSHV